MKTAINLAALALAAVLAFGLYKAKTEAKEDRARIAELEIALAAERESLVVLRNEIAYLEDPGRLRALAAEHLNLAPADPLRVVTLEDAPLLFALPEPRETDVVTASARDPGRR